MRVRSALPPHAKHLWHQLHTLHAWPARQKTTHWVVRGGETEGGEAGRRGPVTPASLAGRNFVPGGMQLATVVDSSRALFDRALVGQLGSGPYRGLGWRRKGRAARGGLAGDAGPSPRPRASRWGARGRRRSARRPERQPSGQE